MMKQNKYYQLGYGGIEWFFAAVVVGFIIYFFVYPTTFKRPPPLSDNKSNYCRPYLNTDGTIKSDAPTIMAPTYEYGNPFPEIHPDDMQPYRLIKSSVPLKGTDFDHNYSAAYLHNQTPNDRHCETYEYNGVHHSHFCQWIHEGIKLSPNFSGAFQYAVMYPAPYSDGNVTRYNGGSDPFNSEVGNLQSIRFADYHLIFLLHLDQNNQPITIAKGSGELSTLPYFGVDVYQQVDPSDPSKPVNTVPESVLKCIDNPETTSDFVLGPVVEKSPDKKQQQLGWFVPSQTVVQDTWYEPACKPAINLYPTKDTLVNVKVNLPHGFLTYTDPLYPPDTGWNVLAHPNGTLEYFSPKTSSKGTITYPLGNFPYLYYEGKIQDTAITKPDTGFVIAYDKLDSFFDETLPKLGLNNKESTEFKQYWLKALPKSPYYFIGIIPTDQLDTNEPLTITPKQDTMIRVRLFFQQLNAPISVEQPLIQIPKRVGFTVVDWGGYVKQDKNHPFTCLQ